MESDFPTECAQTYHPVKLLARGGFGAVWHAEHRALGTPAAVKVFLGGPGEEEFGAQRFLDEARVTAQLNHPCIVRVLELGLAEEQPWIAYELLSGPTLREWMTESRPIEQVIVAAEAVARALEEAHARGVIHRDVKPENVLSAGFGKWKVADFGIAKWSGARVHTRTGVILGTPTYIAPESLQGFEITAAVDVYSLGVMLFEMIEGAPPYRSEQPLELMSAHIDAPVPPLLRPDVPERVRRLVDRMLAKDAAARPDSTTVRADLGMSLAAFGRGPTGKSNPSLRRVVSKTIAVPERHSALEKPVGHRARAFAGVAIFLGGLLSFGVWRAAQRPDSAPPTPAVAEEPEGRREKVGLLLERLQLLSVDADRALGAPIEPGSQLETRVESALAQALDELAPLAGNPDSALSRKRAHALLLAVQVAFMRDASGVRSGSFERIRSTWRGQGMQLIAQHFGVPAPLAGPAEPQQAAAWMTQLRQLCGRLEVDKLRFVAFLLGKHYVDGLVRFAERGALPATDPVMAEHYLSYAAHRQMSFGVLVRADAPVMPLLKPLRARAEELVHELEGELTVYLRHAGRTMIERINLADCVRSILRYSYRLQVDTRRVLARLRALQTPGWSATGLLAWAQVYGEDPGWRATAVAAADGLQAEHPAALLEPGQLYAWTLAVRQPLDCATEQRADPTLSAQAHDLLKRYNERFAALLALSLQQPELGRQVAPVLAEMRASEIELGVRANPSAPPAGSPSPAPSAAR